jgi:hypothetical protein
LPLGTVGFEHDPDEKDELRQSQLSRGYGLAQAPSRACAHGSSAASSASAAALAWPRPSIRPMVREAMAVYPQVSLIEMIDILEYFTGIVMAKHPFRPSSYHKKTTHAAGL